MGLTFKENCPDLRNTRVVDIVSELKDYNCQVDVYDPWVNPQKLNMSMVLHQLKCSGLVNTMRLFWLSLMISSIRWILRFAINCKPSWSFMI